jgi:hypothetical protein
MGRACGVGCCIAAHGSGAHYWSRRLLGSSFERGSEALELSDPALGRRPHLDTGRHAPLCVVTIAESIGQPIRRSKMLMPLYAGATGG